MVDDIVNLYNFADFVIGRSGAGVTAECFFKHLPMMLIPLENKATRGDQLLNAKYYENLGVAKIIREQDLIPTLLLNEIYIFSKNLNHHKTKFKSLKQINGREIVVSLINKYSDK